MPARLRLANSDETPRRPATTPEGRENELISAAYDLAAEQIERGTATSQVITHFLKLGSTRERLEQQRLEHEVELTRVKVEHLESEARREELFTEAIQAMRQYQGDTVYEDDPNVY